ncbi:transporter substrate-binding domain-containing protein [Undibacterium sp. CY18W]|uniref:Transporter substrate-binding domain-containing protein n=1 Tax=Undibacterium hunanense TaxID=2762292 RepID=A0ABR6ZM21_9BURK|nr:transporter substrate-binding domain-containing protein [Undibacterium hunanense]
MRILLFCSFSAVGLQALAACSRLITVPVAATGRSVMINGEQIDGIYPDILRNLNEACKFTLTAVPRARMELMFETGRADLLIPASRTPKRDEHGIFIPMIYNRATLISVDSNRPIITSAQDLLDKKDLKVTLVRGFDYGPAYQDLIRELNKQGRLFFDADPLSVARLLKAGIADITIMAPSILAGAMMDDARVQDMLDKLRFEPIPELPWGDSGAYISKKSLNNEDRAALKDLLEQVAKSGTVWKGFLRYYPANVLKESIRPR